MQTNPAEQFCKSQNKKMSDTVSTLNVACHSPLTSIADTLISNDSPLIATRRGCHRRNCTHPEVTHSSICNRLLTGVDPTPLRLGQTLSLFCQLTGLDDSALDDGKKLRAFLQQRNALHHIPVDD